MMASSTDFTMEHQRKEGTAGPMDLNVEFEKEDVMDSIDSSRPAPESRPNNALSKLVESETDSENDEAPVQLPRTKLLGRLQPKVDEGSSDSEEDEDAEGAYERVKRSLMSMSSQRESQTDSAPAPSTNIATSSDDEDMPVRSNKIRRPVLRREKSSTPRVTASPKVPSRPSSPGLFVSPESSPVKNRNAILAPAALSDSDRLSTPKHNEDMENRIKRIRAERRARQRKEQEQTTEPKKVTRRADQDSDSDPDGENGRRLTQQARPTRRAGKKAMEDIAREQQRISRNMQLTHQAKTKKRYGMKDLLSKFGYNQDDSSAPTPDSNSVLASSDAEGNQHHDTPPTSPPSQEDMMKMGKVPAATSSSAPADALSAPTSPVLPGIDKGKGRAPEFQHLPVNPLVEQAQSVTAQNARVTTRAPAKADMIELSDSDDDVEMMQRKSRFPVFDRLPQKKQQEAPSLLHLRHLAHLTSPGKKTSKGRKSMNITELQFSLAQKARQQAQKERQDKIEDLKSRGIHIETEEEREKHQLEVEDMVAQFEKARQEDLKLAKLEREEAKKNGEAVDDLPSSDESVDEDYVGSGEEEAEDEEEDIDEEAELELSGSEEEDGGEADDEDELDEEEAANESNELLDDAAEEDNEKEQQESMTDGHLNEEDIEEDAITAPARNRPAHRARNVVIDEDDESQDEISKKSTPVQKASQPSQTQQDDDMAAFGFNSAGPNLGLTQMFAGTMANLESDSQLVHPVDQEVEQDSLDFLRSLPDTQPDNMLSQTQDLLVPNSQAPSSQHAGSHMGVAAPITLGVSQLIQTSPAFSHTQLSEAPEPTQDAGFELSRSPAGLIPPPSTIETVTMPDAESPVVKRKGRLQQRKQMILPELSDADDEITAEKSDLEKTEAAVEAGDAFSVMKKAAKKQKRVADNFNKKTSWARDAIEEQAEESEDEYAGLGGASDEDSGEDDEELAQMIDKDEIKVDERKLAAYFAEKAKKDDEKNINQLYKDIMNGGLRKRRAGDAFDMSDSEDEAEQRRRRKQMQFKQMTKALVSDERIGKIAQNPKQAAFFKTLADHTEDPEYDFLNAPEMEVDMEASQSQSQSDEGKEGQDSTEMTVPDSQPVDTPALVNPLKRKATNSQEKENRPPPHLRRTAASDNMSRKPMTIADVQHSVSELLDDPRVLVPASQYSESESELEIEPAKPIRRKAIIDRLSLSRTASLSESNANGNMAFHGPTAGAHQPGFRVPTLIRRATSNSTVSTSSSGTTTPVEGSVRRGGTGRSNIHAQAREAERRAALDKVEKKRKESLKKKVGKARGQRSVLGCLDGGFE